MKQAIQKHARLTLGAALALGLPCFALAQSDTAGANKGQWLPNGAFGISRLAFDPDRKETYLGAGKEPDRVATFLPSMALLYNLKPVTVYNLAFVEGVTHSGIPVAVLKSSLSGDVFEDQRDKDVVTHARFDACQEVDPNHGECLSSVSVGGGHAYSLEIASIAGWVRLFNLGDRRRFYLKRRELDALERNGNLTIHKDRTNPRWAIIDGYASEVSAKCGQSVKADDTTFDDADETHRYDSDPSTWGPDSVNWSLKALEIMKLGSVEPPLAPGDAYSGTVTPYDIGNDTRRDSTATDITVFAYRDAAWSEGFYKFAGLAQTVECTTPKNGAGTPKYAVSVDLFFDSTAGEVPQDGSITPITLRSPYSEQDREELFKLLNRKRSFFYSINHQTDYDAIFAELSREIEFPTAVANIITRLNASCSNRLRSSNSSQGCRQWSKPDFTSQDEAEDG